MNPSGNILSLAIAVFMVIISSLPTKAIAQSPRHTLSVDIAFSSLNDDVDFNLKHRERSYLLAIGYHISSAWSLSTQGTLIRSNLEQRPRGLSSVFLIGLTSEYDILHKSNHRLFIKLGLATGNYCTCGERLPRVYNGLGYVRYGMGTNISVNRYLQLTLGFEANTILNNIPDTYSYNIFYVGIRSNSWLKLGKST